MIRPLSIKLILKKRSKLCDGKTSNRRKFFQVSLLQPPPPTNHSIKQVQLQESQILLNFNGSSKSAEKKPILGLSTNSAVIKKESETPVDGNTLSQYSKVKKPLDIKSAASELKRKMKEDEKSLVEKSLQVEHVHEDADADVLTLFKKKKSK